MRFLYYILFLSITDLISVKIAKYINPIMLVHDKCRWFFIHSCANLFISIYSIESVIECVTSYNNCYYQPWDINSYYAFEMSILLHIYHILFFRLNKADIIHHVIMCGIGGPLSYYQNDKLCTASLFFLTGLPGFIDYFLLYLVKVDILSKNIEKIAYVYLSVWIRSPGLCIISSIAIDTLTELYYTNLLKFCSLLLTGSLTYWNGQYYMMRTCIDYGRKH